jgi:hypothetical protein
MNYGELKAVELKVLCEERGLKVHRAKADMIKELKEYDTAQDIKDYYGDEAAPVPDGVLTDVEADTEPEPQPEPETSAERPVEPLVRAPGAEWVEDGVFLKEFDRGYTLETWEHETNLRQVVGCALAMQLEPYGPPYRVHSRTNAFKWVYGVNVR